MHVQVKLWLFELGEVDLSTKRAKKIEATDIFCATSTCETVFSKKKHLCNTKARRNWAMKFFQCEHPVIYGHVSTNANGNDRHFPAIRLRKLPCFLHEPCDFCPYSSLNSHPHRNWFCQLKDERCCHTDSLHLLCYG